MIPNADIFLGCSAAGALTQDMVKSMAAHPIILALANPNPEITRQKQKLFVLMRLYVQAAPITQTK